MRYLFCIIASLFSGFLFSQSKQLKFESFTTDDGLVSNYVDYVFVDSYGYLWVGTLDGLNRYDGNSFTSYTQIPDSVSLNNNSIAYIYEDWDRQLWIGTMGGVNLYNRELDVVEPFIFPTKANTHETPAIVQSSDSVVWIGTFAGLCKYNKRANSFKWFEYGEQPNQLKDSLISSLLYDDSTKMLWVGTNKGGLYKLNTRNDELTQFSLRAPEPLPTKRIRRMQFDRHGKLWVATFDAGICVVDTLSNRYTVLNTANSNLGNNFVYGLYQTQDEKMWACCINGNLNCFDEETQQFYRYEPDAENQYSINGSSIISMTQDKLGNLWIATHGNGIAHMNKRKQDFKYFIAKHKDSTMLNSPIVTSFLEYENQIWLATDGGGINIYDKTKRTFQYLTKKEGLSSDWVLDLKHAENGYIYASVWQGGINEINPETLAVTAYRGENVISGGELSFDNVKMTCSDDSLLWIGTHGGGVNVYDLNQGEFIKNSNRAGRFFDLSVPLWVNSITKDSKNRIWFCTQQGLFMYDRSQLHTYTKGTEGNYALITDNTNKVYEDAQGNIWLATELGLCLFNENDLSFKGVSRKYGLPNSAKAMVQDKNGDYWISTNNGLYFLNHELTESTRFSKDDGLLSNFYARNSSCLFTDGSVAFGGIEGFNYFIPDKILHSAEIQKVVLQDLFVNNKKISPSQSGSILKKVLALTDTICLSYDQSEFSISYSVISPGEKRGVNYAYRLRGYDDEWRYVDNQHKANYTNIVAGSYIFEVSAYQIGKQAGETVTSLRLIVLPPWWETIWFRVLLVASLAGILFLLYYVKTQSVRRQNLRLATSVRKRTSELTEANAQLLERNEEVVMQNEKLEEYNREVVRQSDKILAQQDRIIKQNDELNALNQKKDKFFSIIAHDLKNPVNALLGFSSLLHNSYEEIGEEKVKDFIAYINTSSNAIYQLLVNLLDWARAESKQIQYKPDMFEIDSAVKRSIEILQQHASSKSINLTAMGEKGLRVYGDENMVETIIRNILSNAIKFTPENGSIVIKKEQIDGFVGVTVIDSGVGMSKETVENLFTLGENTSSKGTNAETGTGIGLLICNEFAEINKGSITVESEPGAGSSFMIQIPASEQLAKSVQLQKQENVAKTDILLASEQIDEPDTSILKKKRVLVVDDNTEVRAAVRFLLSKYCELFEAENGAEALAVAGENLPDIIVSDIHMPEMDGFELCKRIKENHATSHIPIILLTTDKMEGSRIQGLQAKAEAYLDKPFSPNVLIAMLVSLLENRELMKRVLINDTQAEIREIAGNDLDARLLERLIAYVEANMNNPELNADTLAYEAAMSKSLLYTKLKSICGQSINEFIRTIRLRTSVKYLQQKSMTINEIADQCGFNSTSYYIRSFRKYYQMSPTEYAEKMFG